jgi:hypothetical protein
LTERYPVATVFTSLTERLHAWTFQYRRGLQMSATTFSGGMAYGPWMVKAPDGTVAYLHVGLGGELPPGWRIMRHDGLVELFRGWAYTDE